MLTKSWVILTNGKFCCACTTSLMVFHLGFLLFHHFQVFSGFLMGVTSLNGQAMIPKHSWRWDFEWICFIVYYILTFYLGISGSHFQTSPISGCTSHFGIHGHMLYRTLECHICFSPWALLSMRCWIPSAAWSLRHMWGPRPYEVTLSACFQPLLFSDSTLWLPKWHLFFYYRVRAQRKCQKSLGPVKPL